MIFQQIVQQAQQQNKNLLIVVSPRSGTHALGAELASIGQAHNLGEICKVMNDPEPWNEIELLYDTPVLTVAQLVQLTSKLQLARRVEEIKKHAIVVNIRRVNKVKQFASWMYFRVMDPTALHGWHNHTIEQTRVKQHSIEAQEQDISQFTLEQLLDDYFLPDFNLCYEQLTFTQTDYRKNQFPYPIETIFSNLSYVEQCLNNWNYAPGHFKNE